MASKKIKAVFDIDDTICHAINRDYVNAKPLKNVIEKINNLHDELGFEVELYTSRGMISCSGDLVKIEKKNKQILVDWLEKNNVHYDTLTFGKPIADFYVDDKGISLKDFMNNSYRILKGGSGKTVYKIGDKVKKEFGSHNELIEFQEWIRDCKDYCNYPEVHSYLYDSVYMDYIEGYTLKDRPCISDIINVMKVIDKFSEIHYDTFSMARQIDTLFRNCYIDKEIDEMIIYCINELNKYEKEIEKHASFCHGDMTLSNIIFNTKNNKLYFIDSRYFRNSSSYLFDYAKLKMSIDGYENKFGMSSFHVDKFGKDILKYKLEKEGITKLVTLIEFMYILRLTRYKKENELKIVKEFAKEVKKEYEELS